jgi:hypothetical protein
MGAHLSRWLPLLQTVCRRILAPKTEYLAPLTVVIRVNVRSALLLTALLAAGCQTSTVESRRAERPSAYEALAPEIRALVDQGQIKVGMNEDAVYIAWGPPSEIVQSETQSGRLTTWLYHSTMMEETRYWAYREIWRGNQMFLERYLERDYDPRHYVKAEIVFEKGAVKEWRTLPKPLGRGRTLY